jgi:16S rRNA (adenine1518-N6/adenine1519-N6)-dimethyltransferase
MLQREVAARLAAPPGADARAALSVMMQTWAEVRVAFGVSRRSFLPQPRVDSAVAVLRFAAAPRVPLRDPATYEAVVRAAFGQRRKMLRNALAALAAARGVEGPALAAFFERAGVDARARAETLALEDFARLAGALEG